jgi:hypothetical protein
MCPRLEPDFLSALLALSSRAEQETKACTCTPWSCCTLSCRGVFLQRFLAAVAYHQPDLSLIYLTHFFVLFSLIPLGFCGPSFVPGRFTGSIAQACSPSAPSLSAPNCTSTQQDYGSGFRSLLNWTTGLDKGWGLHQTLLSAGEVQWRKACRSVSEELYKKCTDREQVAGEGPTGQGQAPIKNALALCAAGPCSKARAARERFPGGWC